ncbi:putative glycosyl hydrolase family 3 protein [Elsinoe australis]|uniref:beta-glucosidase n=1 Tax=Elsinoe australis TaxID=40998 RepID=A0A4U7BED0_9PEZI|nr:putative glycosyl hydrolase family 3 protein [Elsinoe australis]
MVRFTSLAIAILPVVSNGLSVEQRQSYRGNESLPIYRNAAYCVDDRVEDLLSRMTLEEKAGQLFQTQLYQGPNGTLDQGQLGPNSTDKMIGELFMTHFNLVGAVVDARTVATFHNRVQQRALDTRLGIPVTLSTDPRHAFTENFGTSFTAGSFSQWPETLGLAALRDPALVGRFAEIAREEYLAVGIRVALHPMVDLATEPRWARISGTFGEDANLTASLLVPYIRGFQGATIGAHSVTTVTKHFPGAGPAEDGLDNHFTYGKNNTYPTSNQDYHLLPFREAIASGTRQIMPAYSRPINTTLEPVAFTYNRAVVTDLLRDQLGFTGIVVTDWGLITDATIAGQYMPARAWGLEDTSELSRTARLLDAGCDQFGGEQRPDLVIQLVREGTVPESRIDASVRRLLREKFLLGLFDSPFVDPETAARVVGNPYFVRVGEEAQRRSYTLLTNNDTILPLRNVGPDTRFYIEGFNASYMAARNLTVVPTPEEADIGLLRMLAPAYPRPGGFERRYRGGDVEFTAEEKARQKRVYEAVPSVVDVNFDRPVAIPEVFEGAKAVLGSYGSSSEAFLDVVLGKARPEGKLPFDLSRSQRAVEEQSEDAQFDTRDPVFRFGDGAGYGESCAGR